VAAVAVLVVCKLVLLALALLQHIPLLLEAVVQVVQLVLDRLLLALMEIILYFQALRQLVVVVEGEGKPTEFLVEVEGAVVLAQVPLAVLALLVKVIQEVMVLLEITELEGAVVVEKEAVVVQVMLMISHRQVVVVVGHLHL
jgi:hypothetical protein